MPPSNSRYLNREQSWLDFNERVLALAEDVDLPLLERIKFVAISSTNLDEFFQVRVAGLHAQLDAGVLSRSPDGLTPREQRDLIRESVQTLTLRQAELFRKELRPALAREDIHLVDWDALETEEQEHVTRAFNTEIFPILTPLSVDPSHRFPHISNLCLNLAVQLRRNGDGIRFARVKVPPRLPRFLPLPSGERYVPVEQVIAAHLPTLFPGVEVLSHSMFRVTLDAEILVDEGGAADLAEALESGLYRRHRLNDAVRLEVAHSTSPEVRSLVQRELELDDEDVYVTDGPLDLAALWALHRLPRPELKDPPWKPATPRRLAKVRSSERSFFQLLEDGDVLVHHPYDSFSSSVEAFIKEAARDPDVLAIKQTLYRTAADHNPILSALADAARSGKEVVALIEIKARFDERPNIEWARALEDAGVHVIYGVVGLKTHAKIALVVRRTSEGIRRYCHIGTGNYNPITASLYEDVGLFTASPQLGADVTRLFNRLTGYSFPGGYGQLLVAPDTLRPAILELIRGEAREDDGRIVIKMNSLSDPEIIDALYEASQRGTSIDLIVRGICCLRPGVPGLSDNIRVRSLVGRYLEHSRIFRLGSDQRGPRYLIGSADMMGRNLDRRVEALTPIADPELQERLAEILQVTLDDDALAWELLPDGSWQRVPRRAGVCAHDRLQELAQSRAGDAVGP